MPKLKDHDEKYLRYVLEDIRKQTRPSNERRIFFLDLIENALNRNQGTEAKK